MKKSKLRNKFNKERNIENWSKYNEESRRLLRAKNDGASFSFISTSKDDIIEAVKKLLSN